MLGTTLAHLVTWIALANDVNSASTADYLAIWVAELEGSDG